MTMCTGYKPILYLMCSAIKLNC